MRPLGIGRCGSLIASTWRSNQSFTAWLVAQTSGPASSTPVATIAQRPSSGTPEETTPQPKAHIGGNQVIGLSSSATADGAGCERGPDAPGGRGGADRGPVNGPEGCMGAWCT